ncbi:MAG: efflux RND transporter permease subunit [Gammaproteobacteria bacterium]
MQAEAPGLAPEEVERLVTQPLENALNGGANIESIRSESIQGLATIKVTFNEGGDIFRDRQLLAERVAEAAVGLPAGVKTPVLGPMTSSTMDLLKLGFASRSMSPTDLRAFVDWTIRPRLLAGAGRRPRDRLRRRPSRDPGSGRSDKNGGAGCDARRDRRGRRSPQQAFGVQASSRRRTNEFCSRA